MRVMGFLGEGLGFGGYGGNSNYNGFFWNLQSSVRHAFMSPGPASCVDPGSDKIPHSDGLMAKQMGVSENRGP